MGKNRNSDFDAGRTTKSGEMVPSMFNWVTPDIQARIADRLAKTTKNEVSDEVAEKPSSPKKN